MKKGNEYLNIILRGYIQRLEAEKKELKTMPPGSLVFMSGKNKVSYIQLIPASEKTEGRRLRRAINKDPYLVESLARKKYLQKSIELLEKEIERLELFLQRSSPPDAEAVLQSLPEAYKTLPESMFFPRKGTAWKWATAEYNQSTYNPHEKIQLSVGGLRVRTKSELLIADRLEAYQLPFRYEETVGYRQYDFSPDFSIMTKEGIIYWEHCGLMSDPRYRRRNEWKLQIYNKMGIVPWKNLIITYDTEDGGLDLRIIESEIVNKLLPIKI